MLAGDMQAAMNKLHTEEPKKPAPAPKKTEEPGKEVAPAKPAEKPAAAKPGLLKSLFGKK
jgi:hypothetical protein